MTTSEKPLALLDWDGTLREPFTIIDWYGFLQSRNLTNVKYRAEDLQALFDAHKKGLPYDLFAELIIHRCAQGLKGSSANEVALATNSYGEDYPGDRLLDITGDLIALLRDRGFHPVIVSGSPRIAIEAECKKLMVEVRGTEFHVNNEGRYTGGYDNRASAEGKKEIVEELTAGSRTTVGIAFGDSDSDSALMDDARLAVRVVTGLKKWEAHLVLDTRDVEAMRRGLNELLKDSL